MNNTELILWHNTISHAVSTKDTKHSSITKLAQGKTSLTKGFLYKTLQGKNT